MEELSIGTEFIKLSQLLKLSNMVSQGSEAKAVIIEGLVKVNNEVVLERGRKIYKDDVVEYNGQTVKINVMMI
jgi:ribosome-associated protein